MSLKNILGAYWKIEKDHEQWVDEPENIKFVKELYADINSEDLSAVAEDNIENIDILHYIFKDVKIDVWRKILAEDLVKEKLNETSNFVALASGIGKGVVLTATEYHCKNCVGIENIYEMYEASQEFLQELRKNDTNNLATNSNIVFINQSLLAADISTADCIFINYNNTSDEFQLMLENKILMEAKRDCLIIKIFKEFKKELKFRLLKQKSFKDSPDSNNEVFAYYYKIK